MNITLHYWQAPADQVKAPRVLVACGVTVYDFRATQDPGRVTCDKCRPVAVLEAVKLERDQLLAQREHLLSVQANQAARLLAASQALEPIAEFVRQHDRQPLRGADRETLYAIHTGTEWEAAIRWSDLRRCLAAAAVVRAPRADLPQSGTDPYILEPARSEPEPPSDPQTGAPDGQQTAD